MFYWMVPEEKVDKDDEFPARHLVYLIIGTVVVAITVALMIPFLS